MAIISRRLSDKVVALYFSLDEKADQEKLDSNPRITHIGQLRVIDGMPKVGWLASDPIFFDDYQRLYDENDILAILEELRRRENELIELQPVSGKRQWIFR